MGGVPLVYHLGEPLLYPVFKRSLSRAPFKKPFTKPVISLLIVSITKFTIVIGSPLAYLSRNRRAITWVSNCRCPI